MAYAVEQQTITWNRFNKELWYHMASLGPNQLTNPNLFLKKYKNM